MRQFHTGRMGAAQIAQEIARGAPAWTPEQDKAVAEIVAAVRSRGDDAVVEYTRRFDWAEASAAGLRVSEKEIAAAAREVGDQAMDAFREAAAEVRRFHEGLLPSDRLDAAADGTLLGERFVPIDSVGVMAPGVRRLAVASRPLGDGRVRPEVLAMARALGLDEVYRMGGAQAVAAFAFGTRTIPAVDKIAGPGNIYVTLAKRAVYGEVGVDGLYGPSDVVIVADDEAPAPLVAADLIAQAEHGEGSLAAVISPSERLLKAVADELGRRATGSAREILETRGAAVQTRDLDEACEVANALAPEHLELMVRDPEAALAGIRHAGCVFLGDDSPAPVGDYMAGPSHVLPTGRTARFSSGLGVRDFLTRSSVIRVSREWLARHGKTVQALAELEGFEGHARSVGERMPKR
jgi:histidinol dehydrogenase